MAGGLWVMHCGGTPLQGIPCENGNIDFSLGGTFNLGDYIPGNTTCSSFCNYFDENGVWVYLPPNMTCISCSSQGAGNTPGCEYTIEDMCNYWYPDCNGQCTSELDSNCNMGAMSIFLGYNCMAPGDPDDPTDPYTGMGLGYGSGDATGDSLVNIQDVIALVTWVLCGEWENIGEIPEDPIEYYDCNILLPCNGATCPPEGFIDPIYVTQDLLYNADVNQDGHVTIMDVIAIVDMILADANLTSGERDQMKRALRKLSTRSRQGKGRAKPSSRRYNKDGRVNRKRKYGPGGALGNKKAINK